MQVIEPENGAGFTGFGAYPGIEQDDAADAGVAVGVEEDGRRGVAFAPQHHFFQFRNLRAEDGDGRIDIVADVLETAEVSVGIPHAAVVKAQDGVAFSGQPAGPQGELAVAAGPVLGAAADDDRRAPPSRGFPADAGCQPRRCPGSRN